MAYKPIGLGLEKYFIIQATDQLSNLAIFVHFGFKVSVSDFYIDNCIELLIVVTSVEAFLKRVTSGSVHMP